MTVSAWPRSSAHDPAQSVDALAVRVCSRLRSDPRWPLAALLTLYAVLGVTVLRFNRSPLQMLVTVIAACALDLLLRRLVAKQPLELPLSAWITGVSLALLLNYSHTYWLLFVPVFLAIGSKYLLTFEGRHVFNPSMFGVATSLLVGRDLISTAASYQWGGSWAMSAFMVTAALLLFMLRIRRNVLVLSFLGLYLLQILLRAWYMRWFFPPEALILGTLTSAPFYLFVFYMITDPKTSPESTRGQFFTALALVVLDLLFHRMTSLYTFFYAALALASGRFVFLHGRRVWRAIRAGDLLEIRLGAPTLRAALVLGALTSIGATIHRTVLEPVLEPRPLDFSLERLDPRHTGLGAPADPGVLERLDPRVRHIGKWLLSAGDAVATGDYDGDGRLDLFLTNLLARPQDRAALYRNLGDLEFERVSLPALDRLRRAPEEYGLASSALFADPDNDGDQDLIVTVGYGRNLLLRNLLRERGEAVFEDVTASSGIGAHSVSIGANLLDADGDGRLDLLLANALDPWLRGYQPPRPLDLWDLPEPEYPGDRRMLPIMHASWDNASNGGRNLLFLNRGALRFEEQDAGEWGLEETHWSVAVGTGDLDNDGLTDLYIANDFGPDDLYLNDRGQRFVRVEGVMFGSVGRDSYKGMNASIADVDHNGWLDIYVSNVHMPLQAEGSLLWMTRPPLRPGARPRFGDEASLRGALNERRFGWGAAIGDLDLDGWPDIVQANGMIDDTLDRRRRVSCPTYWYVNEKLMRSGPEIHTYADLWGDLRGFCINGREANRVYLSRGERTRLQFDDVAPQLDWGPETPSRGVLMADLDDDGDLDLGVTHMVEDLALYRNTLNERGGGQAWVGFALEGRSPGCNRDAAGSRLWVSHRLGNRQVERMREVTITNAFAAQGDRRLLFGLGDHVGPVEVEVSWCGGARSRMGRFKTGRYHEVIEKGGD